MAEKTLTKMNLFKKKVRINEKQSFDTYFMTFPQKQEVAITTRFTDEVKLDLASSGIEFPMSITLNDTQYFLTKEKYETEEGLEKVKVVCVITGFEHIEHLELEKYSLEKYLEEQTTSE